MNSKTTSVSSRAASVRTCRWQSPQASGVLLLLMLAPACVIGVPTPLLVGPVTGGLGSLVVGSTTFDLADVGYEQTEYFMSGTATAYTSVSPLTSDGRWTVSRGPTTADYVTRLLVYRPTNPRRFNGTVIVEWLLVTAGRDAAAEWIVGHGEMIREGFAWVGVSTQYAGVEGGVAIPGIPSLALKTADPERYRSLRHPGDSFSYDIFSQAARAIRYPTGTNPLTGLGVKVLIAVGLSQSTWRLVTYLNGIQPIEGLFDGFLLRGRSAVAPALSEAPQPAIPAPTPTFIRDDLDVPVLMLQAEGDLTTFGFAAARQADSDTFRLWETAGTAHADTYLLSTGPGDEGGDRSAARIVLTATPLDGVAECARPINSGPQHFVMHAALAALNRWVRRHVSPPRAPRIETAPGPPVTILRDSHGNALGGIRTPQLDVPIATFSGEAQPGNLVCAVSGTTTPFDEATLASLYPSRRAYVRAFIRATGRARRAGFLTRPDAKLLKAAAAESMTAVAADDVGLVDRDQP